MIDNRWLAAEGLCQAVAQGRILLSKLSREILCGGTAFSLAPQLIFGGFVLRL